MTTGRRSFEHSYIMKFIKRLMRLSLLCAGMVAFAGVLWWSVLMIRPLPMQSAQIGLRISPGLSVRAIADQMVEAGVLSEPYSFVLMVKLMGSHVQAGDYVFEAPLQLMDLLSMLAHGKFQHLKVQLTEGKTFADFRDKLNTLNGIQHQTQRLSDSELMYQVSGQSQLPEGWFFPDTYFVSVQGSDLEIYQRAYTKMRNHLEQAWQSRASDLPYQNAYEALIMASIVEKETGVAAERPLIAGVFVNRLRKGMRLQTDPTVIYGIGPQFNGNITRKDLQRDTPYNTYTRNGLPPTPIALPGLAAIHAALHPAATNALYFVADGSGGHVFNATLDAHNRAVRKYQLKKK